MSCANASLVLKTPSAGISHDIHKSAYRHPNSASVRTPATSEMFNRARRRVCTPNSASVERKFTHPSSISHHSGKLKHREWSHKSSSGRKSRAHTGLARTPRSTPSSHTPSSSQRSTSRGKRTGSSHKKRQSSLTRQKSTGDRHIPVRQIDGCISTVGTDILSSQESVSSTIEGDSPCSSKSSSEQNRQFHRLLSQTCYGVQDAENQKILRYSQNIANTSQSGSFSSLHNVLYNSTQAKAPKRKPTRNIPTKPIRILDAPDIADDFYVNLLSWNKLNRLAVGLENVVYIWNADEGTIKMLNEIDEDEENIPDVFAVEWMKDDVYLAVGMSDGTIQIWDTEAEDSDDPVLLRTMSRVNVRGFVGALAANPVHGHALMSGSEDGSIHMHDIREQHHHVAALRGHSQKICGIKWSDDGEQMASGGNDNTVYIWQFDEMTNQVERIEPEERERTRAIVLPRHEFTESQAAVKAISWCPWKKHLLAVGGGTADRNIRFYNTRTGVLLHSVDTKSQVTGLVWSPHHQEILSTHGFSNNQLTLWTYPAMAQIKVLTGHTQRITHIALDPAGVTVCTAASDETLRFWEIFEPAKTKDKEKASCTSSSFSSRLIR
eukprot:129676_1